jgi:DNA-directed RNA polymerase subunit N (RpoN/RPB10)
VITHNRIRCLKCGDIIESKHVHDFVRCSCGSVSVDGGHDYLRFGWPRGDPKDWLEELHEFSEELAS